MCSMIVAASDKIAEARLRAAAENGTLQGAMTAGRSLHGFTI